MSYPAVVAISVLALILVAGTHILLTRDTTSRATLWRTRALLMAMALGFGSAMAWLYADATLPVRWVIFFSAAGATHVPAGAILLLKHWQHMG